METPVSTVLTMFLTATISCVKTKHLSDSSWMRTFAIFILFIHSYHFVSLNSFEQASLKIFA